MLTMSDVNFSGGLSPPWRKNRKPGATRCQHFFIQIAIYQFRLTFVTYNFIRERSSLSRMIADVAENFHANPNLRFFWLPDSIESNRFHSKLQVQLVQRYDPKPRKAHPMSTYPSQRSMTRFADEGGSRHRCTGFAMASSVIEICHVEFLVSRA